jgi:hypothetical protein
MKTKNATNIATKVLFVVVLLTVMVVAFVYNLG